jgi:hypothetical protein
VNDNGNVIIHLRIIPVETNRSLYAGISVAKGGTGEEENAAI